MMAKRQQKQIKLFSYLLLAIVFSLSCAALPDSADCQENMSLTSDSMNYYPDTGQITAVGNVHFKRPDGEIFGDRGEGSANGNEFEMQGNVRGTFAEESMDITCDSLRLANTSDDPPIRRIVATGNVNLTRNKDKLTAETVTWEMNRDNYKAAGRVLGNFETYSIDANEVARNGDQFWARQIRRYHDKARRVTLKAGKANGSIRNGDVVEMIAENNVVVDMPDTQGQITRVTGDKGVFSEARGTIVVSGNATVSQGGRQLNSGSIVYHVDSGRIDALERPSLTFELPQD